MTERTDHYTRFYKSGGWQYEQKREVAFFTRLFGELNLHHGCRVLELGCGMGRQSAAMASMGYDVTGVEVCAEGVKSAEEQQTTARFICDSAGNIGDHFGGESFDVIYVRGMSWFHYELDGYSPRSGVDVRQKTKFFFEFLKPGGIFILQIATDFSGETKNGVLYNTLDKYIDLFSPLGTIIRQTNWAGVELTDQIQASKVGGNIIIATRKNK